MAEPWNVNIHYDGLLDRCVPPSTMSVLDVGCGDGFLAARLAQRVPTVVALDIDAPVLGRAKQRFHGVSVDWKQGDVRDERLNLGPFDAVVSNAALHHLGSTELALRRLRRFVRPGGILAVVSFVRGDWRDWPWLTTAYLARGTAIRLHGKWEHSAPTLWPPPETFREVRRSTAAELPTARVSRLLFGRVFIRWHASQIQLGHLS